MRKQLLATMLAAALPLAAAAQGGPPGAQPPQGQGPGAARPYGQRFSPEKQERMEKRMRLARTLGLAEALDLDAPAALKLGETVGRFDDRRVAAHKQLRDARDVLRRAAQGEKVSAAEVDGAVQKALDARAQLTAINRETVAAVTAGLTPEKKARAVLFLSRFQHRFPGHMGRGMGPGPGGPGMHRGMGPGPRYGPGGGPGGPGSEWGMGPGPDGAMGGLAMGPGGPGGPGDLFDDDPED